MSQRLLCRTGLAAAAVTALVLAIGSVSASAAASAMTLSSAFGPSGGGSTITGTTPSAASPFAAGRVPTVQFQFVGAGYTACNPTAKEVAQIAASGATTTAGVLTVDPERVLRFSSTKIAFPIPSSAYPDLDDEGNPSAVNADGLVLVGAQTSSKWNVCAYSDATPTGTLLATASYTLVLRPAITSILPTSSPAAGGQTITVNGVGFSAAGTALTGSIGGAALTDIKVAADGKSLTATTGARAAGTGLALTLNTAGGTLNSLDPDDNGAPEDNDVATDDAPIPFDYTNGITITPNTAAADSTVSIDVIGAGFSSLTFSDGVDPTDTQAHVFLVSGAYEPDSNRGVAECKVLVVVSDNELVCTLDLSADKLSPTDSAVVPGAPISEGAYILTVVANGATDADADATPTIISSGATFTVAPY